MKVTVSLLLAACLAQAFYISYLTQRSEKSDLLKTSNEEIQTEPEKSPDSPDKIGHSLSNLSFRSKDFDNNPESTEVLETNIEAKPSFETMLVEYFNENYLSAWHEVYDEKPNKIEFTESREAYIDKAKSLPADMARKLQKQLNLDEKLAKVIDSKSIRKLLEFAVPGRSTITPDQVKDFANDHGSRSISKAIDGKTLEDKPELPDGSNIQFGEGIFRLGPRQLSSSGRSFPANLKIAGAGMDSTILEINRISVHSEVSGLQLSDMTIDTKGSSLFQAHSAYFSISMKNVRVLGFDKSVIFSAIKPYVRAVDCEFLGGYGTETELGKITNSFLFFGHFEDCKFSLINPLIRRGTGATKFYNCTFETMLSSNFLQGRSNVSYENCENNRLDPRGPRKNLPTLLPHLFR